MSGSEIFTPQKITREFESITELYTMESWTFRDKSLLNNPAIQSVHAKISDLFFRIKSHLETPEEFRRWLAEARAMEVSQELSPLSWDAPDLSVQSR